MKAQEVFSEKEYGRDKKKKLKCRQRWGNFQAAEGADQSYENGLARGGRKLKQRCSLCLMLLLFIASHLLLTVY
jgi:hypothetical protein